MKKIFLQIILLIAIAIAHAQSSDALRSATDDTDSLTKQLEGNYALVAGGSKGIGYAIAEALAKRKYNLILIARHLDSLLAAKHKLETAYGVHVEVLVNDLARAEAADEITKWCTDRNVHLKMLCNVAGFGGANDYLSPLPLDSLRYMVHLNIESVMALTFRLHPLLKQNAPSYILNVASMAGFAPIPVKNLYSATKAAVVFFSYSLRYQLKKENISVSCLAPGPVFTKPSIVKDTKEKLGWFGMKMAVPPKKVGETAVRKTLKRNMIIVPGTLAKITSVVIRTLPMRFIVSLNNKVQSKDQ
ncbi:MAG: SDR family NAD(P)-dependent oxidoreductase [Chitinophagaceae bacterium]|nr:SDR family NAD(P)-dependent oxidoreductase [Chitinophagaceae bacterium]